MSVHIAPASEEDAQAIATALESGICPWPGYQTIAQTGRPWVYVLPVQAAHELLSLLYAAPDAFTAKATDEDGFELAPLGESAPPPGEGVEPAGGHATLSVAADLDPAPPAGQAAEEQAQAAEEQGTGPEPVPAEAGEPVAQQEQVPAEAGEPVAQQEQVPAEAVPPVAAKASRRAARAKAKTEPTPATHSVIV